MNYGGREMEDSLNKDNLPLKKKSPAQVPCFSCIHDYR